MARISIDNGNNFYEASEINEIWDEIEELHLYDVIVNVMDDDIREKVHYEFTGETDKDFLKQYLEIAEDDLTIG